MGIIRLIKRLIAKSKAKRLEAERIAAFHALQDAYRRGDCRDIHTRRQRLLETTNAVLRVGR